MKSTMLVGISLDTPSWSKSSLIIVHRRRFDLVRPAVEHHPGGGDDSSAPRGGQDVRVRSFEAHLRVEGAHCELPDGDGFAVEEERADTEVCIHPFDS